jgi:hypothetical protein
LSILGGWQGQDACIWEVILKGFLKFKKSKLGIEIEKEFVRMGKIIGKIWIAMVVLMSMAHAKFDGVYAGASLGYMNQNTSIDAKQNPANRFAHVNKGVAQKGSPMAEIFVGWGKVFGGCFYGGLEGQIDWVSGKSQKVAEDTNFIYLSGRKGAGFAALVRLGFLVTPTVMIYGGVGMKAVRFDHNMFEKPGKISAPFSQRTLNLLTEVGIETVIGSYENFRLRFAYAFMPKKGMTRTTTQFPIDHVYRDHGILKTGGAEHALKMGLIYRF